MEILFWLEPLFNSLCWICFLLGSVFVIVFALFLAYSFDCRENERSYPRNIAKKFAIASVSLFLVGCLLQPLSQPMNVYKNILIYRGINSTLADKTINTAEKALEVFNKKLDEQLKEKK